MNDNSSRKSIVGGMIWKMGERLLGQGVSFVVSVILARLLVPDDYGLIALTTVFLNLANVFIVSGFSTALIQKKDADDRDFSTVFFCSQLCAIVLYAILYATAPLVAAFYERTELVRLLRVFALLVPISVYNNIQNAHIARHMQFRKTFIASIISAVLSGTAGIVLAYLGFGVWALVMQYMLNTVINTIVLCFTVSWHPTLTFCADSAKKMMAYGSRVLLADLSGTFFGELRSLIIGRAYTSADLAFYSKGQQLPTLITTNLSNTIIAVMFPALSNESDHLEQVKLMTKRSMKVLSFVMVPCMLGMAAVMEPLILLLFTDKWAQTIPYGQVLSLAYCVNMFTAVSLQVLKAIGRSDVVLKLEVIKKPVYVLLLVIGVKINVFAVALTMLLYDCYGTMVNMGQLKKYIGYSLAEQFRDLMPAFALGTAMAVVVLLIPMFDSLIVTLIVKVLAGVLVYAGGAMLFKVETFRYLWETVSGMLRR